MNQPDKTVFVFLNLAEAVRNYTQNGVLGGLVEAGFRCVLFCKNDLLKKAARESFGDRVIIEEFGEAPWKGTNRLLQRVITYTWRTRIKYGDVLIRHGGEKKWTHPFQNLMGFALRPVSPNTWDRIYQKHADWPAGEALYQKYKPVAALISNPVAAEGCAINFLKTKGVFTACLQESWDNLTIRGGLYCYPDAMLVWNTMMRDWSEVYHRMPKGSSEIVGIPSFDFYFKEGLVPSEEAFRKQWNIEPGRPIITYTTSSMFRQSDESMIIDALLKARDEGKLQGNPHILVRVSPKDSMTVYEGYMNIPGLTIMDPNSTADMDFIRQGQLVQLDDEKAKATMDWGQRRAAALSATMRYSSVVVNIFSTVILDAYAHTTPVVAIAFDPTPRPEARSVRRFLRDQHIQDILEFDSLLIAESADQMVEQINRFLSDPKLLLDARQKCSKTLLTYLDGKCSRRVADFLQAKTQKNRA